MPGDLSLEQLSDSARSYIDWGEKQGYSKTINVESEKDGMSFQLHGRRMLS